MYDRDELIEQAIKTAEAEGLITVVEVAAMVGCSRTTLYDIAKSTDRLDELKGVLENNRIAVKAQLRRNWADPGAPAALQIALYKLLGDEDERAALGAKSARPETAEGVGGQSITLEIQSVKARLVTTLQDVNRYSEALDPATEALASALATLNAANRVIGALPSPFIVEESTQGKKIIQHPAFEMQRRAIESINKQSKLLGLDYENAPSVNEESEIVKLTRGMLEAGGAGPKTIEVKDD